MSWPCPDCNGKGHLEGFACPGFYYVEVLCGLCKGIGETTQTEYKAVANGKVYREYRVEMKVGLKDMAEKLGLDPMMLARIEMGLEPLTLAMQKELSNHRTAGTFLAGLSKAMEDQG